MENGEVWMQMIVERNLTTHSYDPDIVQKLLTVISTRNLAAFKQLEQHFANLTQKQK